MATSMFWQLMRCDITAVTPFQLTSYTIIYLLNAPDTSTGLLISLLRYMSSLTGYDLVIIY